MGAALSTTERSLEDIINEKEAKLRERRRRLIYDHGVLIPPAFGLIGTPSQKGTGPGMSIQHRLMEDTTNASSSILVGDGNKTATNSTFEPVSYVQYLQETDLSTCLLMDHMRPGLYVAAQTDDATMLRMGITDARHHRRTLQQPTTLPVPTLSTSFLNSLFFIERKLLHHVNSPDGRITRPFMTVQLRGTAGGDASSSSSPSPSLSGSWHASRNATVFASTSTTGNGWLGFHYDKTFHLENQNEKVSQSNGGGLSSDKSRDERRARPYEGLDTMSRNTVNCKVGAWAPVAWRYPLLTNISSRERLHGYAALNLLGATAAIHASAAMPSKEHNTVSSSSNSALLSTHSYFSMNINDGDQPPLQITLEQRHQAADALHPVSIVSLSQVVAFDRWQWNPWEDRAPSIRNTIAWTIRMESSSSGSTSPANGAEDSGTHVQSSAGGQQRTSAVTLGAAWQLNRGLAIKGVVHPHDQRLTTAILFKHWNHPRVAVSLLHSWNYGSSSWQRQFLGLGIEVETGVLETDSDAYYYNHHPSQSTLSLPDCKGVPQTRATLPPRHSPKRESPEKDE